MPASILRSAGQQMIFGSSIIARDGEHLLLAAESVRRLVAPLRSTGKLDEDLVGAGPASRVRHALAIRGPVRRFSMNRQDGRCADPSGT